MSKPKLICVIGRTSAGKDTLAYTLSIHTGIKIIVSYTTRPKRVGENNGDEHWFITEEEYQEKYADKEKLAYTEINGFKYFTIPEQIENSERKTLFYIIDPQGYYNLYYKFKDKIDIKTIYVEAPRELRKARYNNRESGITPEIPFDERDAAEDKQFTEFESIRKDKCDIIVNTENIDLLRFIYDYD